jgi:Tetratricopeptide repeat
VNLASDFATDCPLATDGEIAVINLESARRRSWSRFSDDPHRPGVAELIVEQEWHVVEFLGDFNSLDRLETLAIQVEHAGLEPARRALIQAQVASIGHRFEQARTHLVAAERAGAEPEPVRRLALSIDQACGVDPDKLLDARRRMAEESESLEVLLPLGSLLAELNEFTEADKVFRRALGVYSDVSPFPVAQVCFQLGVLWGEVVPDRQTGVATQWYRHAIDYIPHYTRARLHLAEIYSSSGRPWDAEALLAPVMKSSDPEVRWRLSDFLRVEGRAADTEAHLQAARSGFEDLLERHLLAFADHGAEFFAGSGDDPCRALGLARLNLTNRPTLRAFELAHAIALSVGDNVTASELLTNARNRWGAMAAFQTSPLARHAGKNREGEHDVG